MLAATSRSYVQGTSMANDVAPVNPGTSADTCAQRSTSVVDAQRSGGPKSSTSRSWAAAS